MPSESTIERIVAYAGRLRDVDPQILREGLQIIHLHHQIDQITESHLATWGLTARQVDILESLYHNAEGIMTPADLSDEVGLTRSAMTSALDSLEKRGYTLRAPHPSDRRMIAVSLTKLGREFIGKRLPERYEMLHRIMNGLSQNDRTALLRVYRKTLGVLIHEIGEGRP
jgi:MarR family transcriptional regulator, negative regulator of the multidrug operon emrRAB